jgi:twitching motility protein PilT
MGGEDGKEACMTTVHDLLEYALAQKASDLMIKAGSPPILRVDGRVVLTELPSMSAADCLETVRSIQMAAGRDQLLNLEGQPTKLEPAPEISFLQPDERDYVFTIPNLVRVRANVFLQQGTLAAALRIVSLKPHSLDELGLPPILKDLALQRGGLILVTGATGSGKSTTLAALVDHINHHRRCNVITIEDPIEYVFHDDQSVIYQREVRKDSPSFMSALHAVLRQTPDVIMVGEMRRQETMEATLMAAEMGHLVLSTLHTISAPATVDRILNAFPAQRQAQILAQLTTTLRGIVAQRLVQKKDGGRVAAVEVMTASPSVLKLIEDGQMGNLAATIREGGHYGMVSMNQSLERLVRDDTITLDEAMASSPNPTELRQLLRQGA